MKKARRSAELQVPAYWVTDPDTETIEVYQPGGGGIPAERWTDRLVWLPDPALAGTAQRSQSVWKVGDGRGTT